MDGAKRQSQLWFVRLPSKLVRNGTMLEMFTKAALPAGVDGRLPYARRWFPLRPLLSMGVTPCGSMRDSEVRQTVPCCTLGKDGLVWSPGP